MKLSLMLILGSVVAAIANADPPSCLECTSLECQSDKGQDCAFILNSVHKAAGDYLEIYRHSHPTCPTPMDEQGWDQLEEVSSECEEHQNITLGCSLLNFKVFQNCNVNGTMEEITYNGQVIGCPKKKYFEIYEKFVPVNLLNNNGYCAFLSERKVKGNCTFHFSLAICKDSICFENSCWKGNTSLSHPIDFPKSDSNTLNPSNYMLTFLTIVISISFNQFHSSSVSLNFARLN